MPNVRMIAWSAHGLRPPPFDRTFGDDDDQHSPGSTQPETFSIRILRAVSCPLSPPRACDTLDYGHHPNVMTLLNALSGTHLDPDQSTPAHGTSLVHGELILMHSETRSSPTCPLFLCFVPCDRSARTSFPGRRSYFLCRSSRSTLPKRFRPFDRSQGWKTTVS